MAQSRNNPLTTGIRGMLGNTLVFRQLNGKTIISNRPTPPKKSTIKQQITRNKFREATRFAKTQMQDPQAKAYYQEKATKIGLPNAYTAAITDYMRNPQIEQVTSGLNSREIVITASKKGFEIKEVKLQILDANEIQLEEGVAVKTNLPNQWIYTIKANNISPLPSSLIVKIRHAQTNSRASPLYSLSGGSGTPMKIRV